MSHILNTTISDARNAKARCKQSDIVNGCGLRTSNSHYFLSDASATTAHTNTKTICTSSNEIGRLFASNNIASDDIKLRILLLDVMNHLDLVNTISLTAVQDNNVQSSINQLLKPVFVIRTC